MIKIIQITTFIKKYVLMKSLLLNNFSRGEHSVNHIDDRLISNSRYNIEHPVCNDASLRLWNSLGIRHFFKRFKKNENK